MNCSVVVVLVVVLISYTYAIYIYSYILEFTFFNSWSADRGVWAWFLGRKDESAL